MTRRLTAVLLAVSLLITVGIVVGAKAVVGDHHKVHKVTKVDRAMVEGAVFAAAVNFYSRRHHLKMRLRPVHCAKDPSSYACSFWQTPRKVCRFARFTDRHGKITILLAGLVPVTFCKSGTGVR